MILLSDRDVDNTPETTPTTEPPARQRFRTVLTQVATDAKQALPSAVNGRVEAACQLILRGDVLLQDDGSAVVGSQTSAETTYTVRGGNKCSCPDAAHRPELQGWCKHAISRAMLVSLQRRLETHDAPHETSTTTTTTPAQGHTEAPASVNVRVTVAGRDVQLTLRDTDEARLLARLTAVLERFPASSDTVAAPTPSAPRCPDGHGAMRPSKKGRGFYCAHKIDNKVFCPRKSPGA